MRIARSGRCGWLAIMFVLAGAQAAAQAPEATYPSRPIRVIVPFPPGGPTDLYARVIAQKMQESWGQPVLVENRVGGTGQVGSSLVLQAPPDGHTLLFTSNSAHVISPLLRNPRPFDPVRDFTPVTIAVKYPMYLLINPALPAKTIPELIALAKSRPGQLNYSSVGIGSGGHLACELFNISAGTNIVHVPYKGAAPIIPDLIGGQIALAILSAPPALAQARAGKLKAIALTSPVKLAAAPDWPALADTFPGFDASPRLFVLAPAGTPTAIIARLDAALKAMLTKPAVQETLAAQGATAMPASAEELGVFIAAEVRKWSVVARESGAKAQ